MNGFQVNLVILMNNEYKGVSANADPTVRNCTTELPTFGVIAGVNQARVQWQGLARAEPSE